MIFNKRCDGDRWDYGAYQDFGDNVIRCHHERGVLCGRGEDRFGRDCAVYMQLESGSARRGGDGGHAMILSDFPGNLLLVFHQPNTDSGNCERAQIYRIKEAGNKLVLDGRWTPQADATSGAPVNGKETIRVWPVN
jgi:hypothetical protein